MDDSKKHLVGMGGVQLAPGVVIPRSSLQFSFMRSSGPGGQNVNKLATKVRLHVEMNELVASMNESARERFMQLVATRINDEGMLVITDASTRSQRRNKDACLDKLRALMIEALRPIKTRRKRRVSKAQQMKRLADKKHRANVKQSRAKPQEKS